MRKKPEIPLNQTKWKWTKCKKKTQGNRGLRIRSLKTNDYAQKLKKKY